MIAVIKNDATKQQLDNLIDWFNKQGVKVHLSQGEYCTVLGLIGDTTKIDVDLLNGLDIMSKHLLTKLTVMVS